MKRFYLFIAFIMNMMLSHAEIVTGKCGDNLSYIYDSDSKILTIKGMGEMYDYGSFLPWELYKPEIQYIELNEGITHIGLNAFQDCSAITSIKFPNSLISIGDYAFQDCKKLTSITVSSNINIGKESWLTPFAGCDNLKQLIYAEGCETTFPIWAPSITSVTLPSSLTSISDYAFCSFRNLPSISIPNSVTRIGEKAFCDCISLASLFIPNSVTSIGADAFSGCYVKNGNYNNMGTAEANGLTIIDLEQEDGLLIRGDVAIACRPHATSVTIPNSVKSIGKSTFSNCFNLASLTIPASVTSIENPFNNVYIAKDNIRNYSSCRLGNLTICDSEQEDGLLIKDNVAVFCRRWATSVVIPDFVTDIRKNAFEDCHSLTSVIIGNSVKNIGECAFMDCLGLTSVVIPNSVVSIGVGAFYYCIGLVSVTIPASVKSIQNQAFYYCTHLSSVTNLAPIPQELDSQFEFFNYGDLHVLPGCGDVYRSGEYWSQFNIIEDAVDAITSPTSDNQVCVKDIYTLDGNKGTANGKGLQIIRYSDGSVRKMMKK